MKDGAREFIEAVYGSPFPKGLRCELWNLHTRQAETIAIATAAEAIVPRLRRDTYVSVGFVSKPPAKNSRTTALQVAGIPALWLDIDVNGGPESKRGAMPSRAAAVEFASAIAQPTILVDSGYGVHAWWVFDEPWIFQNDLDRQRAARLASVWQAAHRQIAAEMHDAKLDSTHDLARLMRLPGTVNTKGGGEAAVSTIAAEPGVRLSVEQAIEILERRGAVSDSAEPSPSPATEVSPKVSRAVLDAPGHSSAGGLTIDLQAEPPETRFNALMENHETFADTWRRTRKGKTKKGTPFSEWSHSEWDFALASIAGWAEWSPQEVADLLVAYRRFWDPTGDKAARRDYIPRTVARVFDTLVDQANESKIAEAEARTRRRESEQTAATIDLADLQERVDAGEDVSVEAMAGFNRVIASGVDTAPRVVEIVQTSTDPAACRYTLGLADGSSMVITPAQLLQPRGFAQALMAVTGHVMSAPRASHWQDAIRVLLAARVVHVLEDVSTLSIVSEIVDGYCTHAQGARDNDVVAGGEPFVDDSGPRFTMQGLLGYIGRRPGGVIAKGDVAAALRAAGWKASPVTYRNARGVVTSRSYYGRTQAAIPLPDSNTA